MILLIGMLLFKEEDVQKKKREEHLSVLYTPLLRKTESEEISFFTPFGGRSQSRTSNSTEKDNTFLHESHREREERIKERERR